MSNDDKIFTANKTSARLLVDFARARYEKTGDEKSGERFLLIYDLYIKARSYAIINKVAFWLAIAAGVMVLVWPSVAVVTKDFGIERDFLKSAIVQTTITGLAALTFAIYNHYKKRQLHAENLMRVAVFSDASDRELIDMIVREMRRIDTGFGFVDALTKKSGGDTEKQVG